MPSLKKIKIIYEIHQLLNSPASHGNKSESLITHVEDRAGHDRRYAINALKISSELSYPPKESFEKGILKALEWYRYNQKIGNH